MIINKRSVNHLISSLLCSFSQIMLQNSPITGLFFVLGIGLNSPIMLFGATIAVLSALVVAQLLHFNDADIHSGLYGFNAALAGIAVLFFLPANFFSILVVIIIGALNAVMMQLMLRLTSKRFANFPVYTSPFILSTGLFLLGLSIFGNETFAPPITQSSMSYFQAVLRGVAQVMLQDYWLSGAIFIAGLLLHSYKLGIWAVIGSVTGVVIARTFEFPADFIAQGLYGFNASLTAIALASRYTNKHWLIGVGILVSILLTRAFELFDLTALTTPFVLASWLIIALVKTEPTYLYQTD